MHSTLRILKVFRKPLLLTLPESSTIEKTRIREQFNVVEISCPADWRACGIKSFECSSVRNVLILMLQSCEAISTQLYCKLI